MNKSDLIYEIGKQTELPKDTVERVISCVFKIIRKSPTFTAGKSLKEAVK